MKIYEKTPNPKKPSRKVRGSTFEPAEVDDFWALLLEKAFAKMVGGYMHLEGGYPRSALTFLSGGITTTDIIDDDQLVIEAVSRVTISIFIFEKVQLPVLKKQVK